MSGYVTGVPLPNQSLGQTQPTINTNFTVLNGNFAVDHVDFTNAPPGAGGNGGRHNTVTLVQQAGDPTAATVAPIIYTKSLTYAVGPTTRTELFMRAASGDGGTIIQMSNLFGAPTIATQGSTFLPGGLMLKWGTYTIGGGTNVQPVAFAGQFPRAVFSLTITCSAFNGATGVPGDLQVNYTGLGLSGFNGQRIGATANGASYSYIAIGN